jgi:hypothetical protein
MLVGLCLLIAVSPTLEKSDSSYAEDYCENFVCISEYIGNSETVPVYARIFCQGP